MKTFENKGFINQEQEQSEFSPVFSTKSGPDAFDAATETRNLNKILFQ